MSARVSLGAPHLKTRLHDSRDPVHYREWKTAWRDKNREHVTEYNREYYRKYRSKAARA